jgi:ketosteroid isomerase-like protein
MMRSLGIIAFALGIIAAAPAQPPAQIIALTQAIIDAANTNAPGKLSGIYTDDAVVVDENGPFIWRGADAGARWWSGVERVLAQGHATLHASAATPSDFQTDREGDDAYLRQKFAVAVTQNGATRTEHGTQTYTFHRTADGTWKISRQIWTTATSSPATSIAPGTDRSAALMMDAFNKRAPDKLLRLYADDATFVDDVSPFVWDGARAGSRWYAKAMRYLKANAIADIHGVVGTPVESRLQGNAAYVILPVTWSGTAHGKPFIQRGAYTLTLRKIDNRWLITSQTWLTNAGV